MRSDVDSGKLHEARVRWKSGARSEDGLRIGVAASFTAEPIAPYLSAALTSAGLGCKSIAFAPYNQLIQACLDHKTAFDGEVDVGVLLWRIEDIARSALHALVAGRSEALEEIVGAAGGLVDAAAVLQRDRGVTAIVAIPPAPHSPTSDMGDFLSGPLLSACHARVVLAVEERISGSGLLRLDLNHLLYGFGEERATDWRKWYLYRQPYAEAFWWQIAAGLGRIVKASRYPRKKCLILDCDNTIWGGVVGEDGIEGIALGDDFPGSAFRDFQRQAAVLAAGGVFIALASKNNPEDVWRVFDTHDAMVLSRDQISIAEIGWDEKAEGIVKIARYLNIGLDALVFVDDSAIEVAKIRERLPDVTCLLAPEECAELPFLLLGTDHFDHLRLTEEDVARVNSFKHEEEREKLRVASSPDSFRRSLQLRLKLGRIRRTHFARVVQLINKTNQFNLTTRRRPESAVAALLADPNYAVLALDVEDRFGSYGIVGVAILKREDADWEVDTFLLSCRALGRGVEQAFMAGIAKAARDEGVTRLRAYFQPTAKNKVAARFLPDIGFTPVSETIFEAALADVPALEPDVTITAL